MVQNNETGITLVETIVAGSLLALAALAAVNLFSKSLDIQGALDRDSQKKVLQRMIRENMDCRNSLGVKPDTVPPVACGKDYVLRLRNGEELFPVTEQKDIKRTEQWASISDWQLRSRCENNEHLLVEVRLAKRDTLNAQLNNWHDLFSGHSRLCREYFAPSMNRCEAPYDRIAGYDKSGAVCCRLQVTVGAGGTATAQCGGSEYLKQGGAECTDGGNFSLGGAPLQRSVVQGRITGAYVGFGASVLGGWSWPPSIGMVPHFFVRAKHTGVAVFELNGVYGNKERILGGFLTVNRPVVDAQGNLNAWAGSCRAADWQSVYPVRSWAVCCPKR